jgi:hypothetical protein
MACAPNPYRIRPAGVWHVYGIRTDTEAEVGTDRTCW